MSFNDKVVIVTGSSGGIGAAVVEAFAKEGADVVIVGRNEKNLEKVSEKCARTGKTPLVVKADVSNDEQTKSIIAKTIEKYGKIDVLINNAGFMKPATILDGRMLDAFDDVIRTNLRSIVHLTTLAAPHLIKTKGNIINMSSVLSTLCPPVPEYLPYCITKAAIDQFTRGSAKELAENGVRVNCINPGPVATDFLSRAGYSEDQLNWDAFSKTIALKRVSEPQEIAELCLFYASNKAKGITGSCVVCDNGYALS